MVVSDGLERLVSEVTYDVLMGIIHSIKGKVETVIERS